MNDEGIKPLGRGRWSIRVKRIDVRIGRVVNRKATVEGTKQDAIAERDRIREELDGKRGAHVKQSLLTYAAAWLERRALKQSTRDKYVVSLGHILRELGELQLDRITPADVAAYVQRRLDAGAAGNTVLNELRLLRTIAKDSVAEGLAERYWCDRVRAPKVARYTSDKPNLLTPAQARLVLANIPPQWLGLVVFLLTTGVRIGEATALRWEDVDVDAELALIERGNYKGSETESTKTGRDRGVPALREVVALWGLRRSSGLVFPSRRGDLHRGSPLRRVLERACEKAGVPRVTTHGLRRTFNNDGRKVGAREVLQAITGHTTDEMTDHYSLVDAREKAELSRSVGERLGVFDVSDVRTPEPAK